MVARSTENSLLDQKLSFIPLGACSPSSRGQFEGEPGRGPGGPAVSAGRGGRGVCSSLAVQVDYRTIHYKLAAVAPAPAARRVTSQFTATISQTS